MILILCQVMIQNAEQCHHVILVVVHSVVVTFCSPCLRESERMTQVILLHVVERVTLILLHVVEKVTLIVVILLVILLHAVERVTLRL